MYGEVIGSDPQRRQKPEVDKAAVLGPAQGVGIHALAVFRTQVARLQHWRDYITESGGRLPSGILCRGSSRASTKYGVQGVGEVTPGRIFPDASAGRSSRVRFVPGAVQVHPGN